MPIIDCPVCKGTGNIFDRDMGGYIDEDCTACRGTGELELTDHQYERREREMAKHANRPAFVHRHAWQDEEVEIIRKFKTVQQTQEDLHEAGFRRSASAIKRMRFLIRQGER